MIDRKNLTIGIEGYVGAGKTSICRELLKKIPNSILLHGGNLYRSIVYAFMKSGVKFEDLSRELKSVDISEIMRKLKVELRFENKETVFYIDGKLVDEDEIQSKRCISCSFSCRECCR